MKRARVHSLSSLIGVGSTHQLIYTVDESNGVNVHGVRFGFIAEPENADANANGVWTLWCMPDEISAVPIPSVPLMELEGSNAFIWAMGVWASSNQTPFNLPETALGTSRNCQQGARIVLAVHASGISAGNVRVVSYLRNFTKSL